MWRKKHSFGNSNCTENYKTCNRAVDQYVLLGGGGVESKEWKETEREIDG